MDLSNEVLTHLKEKLKIKVKTRRDGDFLDVRVELYIGEELISSSEASARVDY